MEVIILRQHESIKSQSEDSCTEEGEEEEAVDQMLKKVNSCTEREPVKLQGEQK